MAKRAIVIGGGASGFFCAVNLARMARDLEVVILEKSKKPLAKVAVSGGGRCNVTHACFDVEALVGYYPRGKTFLKKTFHGYSPNDTVAWFEQRGVRLKTEDDGRMFPVTDSSATIIDCLLREAERYGVGLRTGADVVAVGKMGNRWLLSTKETDLTCDYLCVAVGGPALVARTDWLRSLGHSLVPPLPSLFSFNTPGQAILGLTGLSVPNAIVKLVNSKLVTEGPLLITHWGLSGPAVLKLSAWGARELAGTEYRFRIAVNWLGGGNPEALRAQWQVLRHSYGPIKLEAKNPFRIPARLWKYFVDTAGARGGANWAEMTAMEQNALIAILTAQVFDVEGKTTFKEEFVTCGGIKLSEVDPATMQSRLAENLYFMGEVLDVDGITGGFNFQHAWTSGYIAAQAVAGKVRTDSVG